jgi:hypothetical protein
MSKVIVPGRFGTPEKRARDQLSNDLAMLITPYLNLLGWQTVSNDLLAVVGGLIATASDKPAQDLGTASSYLRKYGWKRAKKMMFAARQGVTPDRVDEEFLKDQAPESDEPPLQK